MRLLADLRDVFGEADKLWTQTILGALHRIPEAPWGDHHVDSLARARPRWRRRRWPAARTVPGLRW